jgi:signal transduction histidine kinase
MDDNLLANASIESQVAGRFGLFPNFFRSAKATPELIEQFWGFAKAGYLDNPMPSLFKERLFVWLSRFCPMRYCIVRHVGFLLGGAHGHPAGDANAGTQSIDEVIALLRRPSPWQRDMAEVYSSLEAQPQADKEWPASGSALEDLVFACAAVMFVEPARSDAARRALVRTLGQREFELFCGCVTFIRTAHYWTMLHPEIETEDDMLELLRGQQELARLLLEDPEAHRSEMAERMFAELAQLRELNERNQLEKAKHLLEQKDRQKDELIAVLAHELRNPLSAIRTAVYTLLRLKLDDGRAMPLVERIDRQASAISRLINDLLEVSRIAFGKVSIELEPFDLHRLLTDALDDLAPHAREAGLQLSADLGETTLMVNGDRMRVGQIVDNLLSNAIKFTPAGGNVHMSLVSSPDAARVYVRDTGIGFDTEFAVQLFEPFVQQEISRDRTSGGLGLGLAICSRLAQLQNCSLTAASPGTGQGALFTLTIPTDQNGTAAQGAPAHAGET